MWRTLLTVLIVIVPSLANVYVTIDAAYPPPACFQFRDTPVIFRSRVVERFRYPDSEQVMTRLSVQERFKGLGPEVTEVMFAGELDSHDWIFYEWQDYRSERYRQFPPAPASWRKLYNAPVYAPDGGEVVEANAADLNFLRSAVANPSSRLGSIEGFAQQNWALLDPNEASWLRGAVVEARNWRGAWKTTTDANGQYRIADLQPGDYAISIRKNGLPNPWLYTIRGTGIYFATTVKVPANGCAVVRASFPTYNSISGVVLDIHGRRAAKVPIDIGEVQADGSVRRLDRDAKSDDQGNFIIKSVPVARIVIGSNIGGPPTRDAPYNTVYAPGPSNPARARIFQLSAGEDVKGVVLRLPPPVPFGELLVNVVWPDGKPVFGGARAEARWNGRRADSQGARERTNEVSMFVALGRTYQITADWVYYLKSKNFFVGPGDPVSVDFKHSGQRVTVSLGDISLHRPTKPAEQ